MSKKVKLTDLIFSRSKKCFNVPLVKFVVTVSDLTIVVVVAAAVEVLQNEILRPCKLSAIKKWIVENKLSLYVNNF